MFYRSLPLSFIVIILALGLFPLFVTAQDKVEFAYAEGKISVGNTLVDGKTKHTLEIEKWGEVIRLVPEIGTVSQSLFNHSSFGNSDVAVEYKKTGKVEGFNTDGGLDIVITLKKKPVSDRIAFTFDSRDIDAFHQPDMRGEKGVKQPDWVVNSIAFYSKTKKDNNYRTGKIGHLYAYKEAGWSIEGKNLVLTIDQKILDTVKYPYSLTPYGDSFGYNFVGASRVGYASETPCALVAIAPDDGTVTTMYLALESDYAMRSAIYSAAGNRLAISSILEETGSFGVFTDIAINCAITNGTTYWLACMGINSDWAEYDIHYDAGAGLGKADDYSYVGLPASWTPEYTLDRKHSIYADYTTGGGETFTPVMWWW